MPRPTLLLLLLLAGTAAFAAPAAAGSLFDRLGGHEGIAAISAELIDRTSRDPRPRRSFEKSDIDRVTRELSVQLCDLSDGPCEYGGDSMRDVHAGHGITQAEFYAMVAILRDVLRSRGVSLRAENELLARLAPMKREIVER